jgi:hypothetical protein
VLREEHRRTWWEKIDDLYPRWEELEQKIAPLSADRGVGEQKSMVDQIQLLSDCACTFR